MPFTLHKMRGTSNILSAFRRAANDGDLDATKAALEKLISKLKESDRDKADKVVRYEDWTVSPLICAALQGHEAIMRLLLSEEAGYVEILQILDDESAKGYDKQGYLASSILVMLQNAMRRQAARMLEFMLSDQNRLQGEFHEVAKGSLESLLKMGASKNSVQCLKILLKHVAFDYRSNDTSETPLRVAADSGAVLTIQFFLSNENPLQQKFFKDMPVALHAAVESCQLDCVKELLQAGADPNLHVAFKGTSHTVTLTLNKALNNKRLNVGDVTPIKIAIYLLLHGSTVDKVSQALINRHKTELTDEIETMGGEVDVSLMLKLLKKICHEQTTLLSKAFFQRRKIFGTPSLASSSCCVGRLSLFADKLEAAQNNRAAEEKSSFAAFSLEQG